MDSIRLLVVDDADLLLTLQPTFVRRSGWSLLTASEVAETLGRTRAERPDLLILDADGWGVEGCRRVKLDAELGETPVILLASDPRATASAEPSADAVLERPAERETLLAAIRRFISVPVRSASRRRVGVEVTYLRGHREERAMTKDLSIDGLFLKSSDPPAIGERLGISLAVPVGGLRTIRGTARVVRAVPSSRDSHLLAGAGVRFVEMSDHDRAELRRFVSAGM